MKTVTQNITGCREIPRCARNDKSARNDKRGAVALVTMLLLGAAIMIMVTSMASVLLSSRDSVFNELQSEMAFIRTEGCAEEALIHLKRNASYAGGTQTLDGLNCTVAVSGSGEDREVDITGTQNPFTRRVTINVKTTPAFGIVNFVNN